MRGKTIRESARSRAANLYFFGLAAGAEAAAGAAAAVDPLAAPAAVPAVPGAAAAFSFRIRIFRCLTFGSPRTGDPAGWREPFS